MKQGWEVKNLVDVCIVERGSSPRPIKKYQTDSSDGVNWIKIGDTKGVEKYIYTTKEKITKEGAEKSRYVKEGDLILSNSMSFGRPYIMKTDGYIHDGWFVLRLHNFIDAEYFFHLLSSPCVNEQFHKLASGSVVQNISGDLVKRVVLPIPSLSEQQRIVAILDEAFAAIAKAKANAEQNLINAKELFESYLQGVFENKGEGWEEKTLGEVCAYDKKSYKNDDLPYVGLEDIQSNTGRLIGPLTPRSVKSLTFHFTNEHILYGRLRPYLNKVLLPDFEGHCSTEIFPIKPNKNILDRSFLYRWLIATETMNKINATWTGATLPRANMNMVLEFKINVPPLKEQKIIVQKLDTLSDETKKLEAIYQQKITDLDELKKSVLQKAFAGELKTKEVSEV
jgi:type I restriction enzyme S subunit